MAIETNELIDVQTLSPFKRFIMTIGNLPTSYLESMTYGELLMWFCNYLQETVIPTVNNNALAVEELQGLYEQLESYVNDYFENLNVQEEINNKLDNMVSDGTLMNMISGYVDPIYSAYETRIDNELISYKSAINEQVGTLNTKIDQATSGSPLVASSTSEMTDTDRVYVNTTDGNWYYYDGDSWEIGGTYQASEDSSTVNQLVQDLNTIVPNHEYLYSILDFTNSTSGKYINPSTGQLNTNASYTSLYYQDVTGGTDYVIHHVNPLYGAWYDSSKTYISGITDQVTVEKNYKVTAPVNAYYCKLSCETTELDELTMKVDETIKLNKDIKIELSQIINGGDITYTTFDVGTGQTYTTLREAFARCVDGSPTNKYIVNFHGDGTEYDISTEFTPAESSDSTFIGRRIPPYTKLYGVGGPEKNIISLKLDTGNAYLSTLNTYGSSEIENITLIGQRTRYVLHDDYQTTNYERKFKNCIFDAISTAYKAVVGAGTRTGDTMIFENCKFISEQQDTSPYICHNNTGFTNPSNLYFINCRFINTHNNGLSVNLRSLNNNTNGIINNAYFYGCKINALSLIEENPSTYGAGIKWKVSGYGNNLKSNDVNIVNTDGLDYSNYVDLI